MELVDKVGEDMNEIKRYNPEFNQGLNSGQVQERIEHNLVNYDDQPPTKTIKQIIMSNFFTYFNFINVVLGGAIIIAGIYGGKFFDALKNYSKNHLVIVSSHNIDLLERYCDQIYSIKDKKIRLEKCLENKKSGINPISTYNTRKKDKIGLSFLDRLKIAYKDLVSKKFRFCRIF